MGPASQASDALGYPIQHRYDPLQPSDLGTHFVAFVPYLTQDRPTELLMDTSRLYGRSLKAARAASTLGRRL